MLQWQIAGKNLTNQTDHADVNAAFNIALRHMNGQSSIDRDIDESLTIFPDYEKFNTDKARSGNVQRVS